MKKVILIVLAVVMVIGIAAFAFADDTASSVPEKPFCNGERIDWSKIELTEEQQQEINDIQSQIFALRTQIIDKFFNFGVITEDQASRIKGNMDQRFQQMQQNGFKPGMGMRVRMKGRLGGRGIRDDCKLPESEPTETE